MSTGIFARAMGRALAQVKGLNGVYLPAGLPRETARDIAREANSQRGRNAGPFAIVVAADPSEHDVGVTEATVRDATKYREGDRLAVFSGQQADLASVGNTFKGIVSPSFPAEFEPSADLATFAYAAIEQCLHEAGRPEAAEAISPGSAAIATAASTLRLLAEAYEALGSTARPWNALWFEHVDTGLELLVDRIQRAEPSEDVENLLRVSFPAAMSLPSPTGGGKFKAGAGRQIAKAVTEWWSDGDTIQSTVALLAKHHDTPGDQHALAEIDWSDFDRTAIIHDSPLLALSTHEQHADDRVGIFQQLTEHQFIHPVATASATLEVFDTNGNSFREPVADGALHILGPSTFEATEHGGSRISSPDLVVRIPTLHPLEEVPSGAHVRMETAPKSASFQLDDDDLFVEDGELFLRGRVLFPVSSGAFTYRARRRRLSIEVDPDNPLSELVDPRASTNYVLLPPEAPGVMFLPLSAKGRAGTPVVVAPDSFTDTGTVDESAEFALGFDASPSKQYAVVAWPHDPAEGRPTKDGRDLSATIHPAGLWAHEFQPKGSDHFAIGSLSVEVSVDSGQEQPVSPVVAAVQKCQPSRDDVGSVLANSLRGVLEDTMVAWVEAGDWATSLGHAVLPTDIDCDVREWVGMGGGEWGGPRDLASVWPQLGNLSVPEALVESPEAEAFRDAFKSLDVVSRLEQRDEAGLAMTWPSRTSWEDLWESREPLERYLASHTALVSKARVIGNPNGIFWAAYPFSVSVRVTNPPPAECVAVLLSPLHPVRLAWLAGVEHTLRRSSSAAALAGTVEGWNLPIVGPHDSNNGQMLAVPIDNGQGQLFLGWSMLVKASVAGPKQLTSPEFIGGRRAPGTAASGLNAGGVAAALRDYRRMKPHVTTLTLDLAASLAAPRLAEIDGAVLREMEAWADAGGLPGGARVLDSLNRRGDAPREQLSDLLGTKLRAPVTWSRYQHKPGDSRPTNVRILQDAGLALEVDTSDDEGFGRLGKTPLRRFEVPDLEIGEHAFAVAAPGVPDAEGWEPFVSALRGIEAGSKHGGSPRIHSQLVGGQLASADAEWTISGEAMVNPSSLASLLRQGGSKSQMLWEWRPPFLEVGSGAPGDALLERRPYLSVVKVPRTFETDILAKLKVVLGEAADRDAVRDLLHVLGARGVGLSSLVAMGGSHASGALGFYSTLRLMDSADTGGADQYVMPIDVCDKFLLGLAGAEYHAPDQQRADLLAITVTDERVFLTPIEIKFYGFETSGDRLPALASSATKGALDQLASTRRLLDAIEARLRGIQDDANRALSANGLAALIEAGMRLSQRPGTDRRAAARRLQDVLDGNMDVVSARPLLAYFLRGATTTEGAGFHSGMLEDPADPGCGLHGEFIANPASVLDSGGNEFAAVAAAWSELLNWSVDMPESSTESGAAETQPPQDEEVHEPLSEPHETTPSRTSTTRGWEEGRWPAEYDEPDGSQPESPAPTTPSTAATRTIKEQAETSAERAIVGDGIRFDVGTLLGAVGATRADHWPSNTSLNQPNIGVVGDLGTGKTQLLKTLVHNLRRMAHRRQANPVSVLIFDYKRDFQDEEFLRDVGGEVLHPEDIPLNIFGIDGEYEEKLGFKKAQTFIDVLKRIFGGIGPVQSNNLLQVTLDLYKELDGDAPTMAEVRDRYLEVAGNADAVVSVLNQFVLGHVFSSDKSALVPFDDLIHDRVLVVDLNSLGADQSLKNALVVLFLNQYYEYMQRLTKWPYEGSPPNQLRRLNSYLLVDEATNIMQYKFDVLEQLMLQGREFGVGVILASQYLSHFQEPGVNYGEPLRTWFIHKVPNVTQKQLSRLGLPDASDKDAERISELGVHEAYYSSLHYPGRFIRGIPYYELEDDGE